MANEGSDIEPLQDSNPTNWRADLQTALCDAYPTPGALEQFVRNRLGKNLHEVAHGNLNERVFQLLEWAEARGGLDDLLVHAVLDSPDATRLADVVRRRLGWPPEGAIDRPAPLAIPRWILGAPRRRLQALAEVLPLALAASRDPSGASARSLRRAIRRLRGARLSSAAHVMVSDLETDIDDFLSQPPARPVGVGARVQLRASFLGELAEVFELELRHARAIAVRNGKWLGFPIAVLISLVYPARQALPALAATGCLWALGCYIEKSRIRYVVGTGLVLSSLAALVLAWFLRVAYTPGLDALEAVPQRQTASTTEVATLDSPLLTTASYDASTGTISINFTNRSNDPVHVRRANAGFVIGPPVDAPEITVAVLDSLAVSGLSAGGALSGATMLHGVSIARDLPLEVRETHVGESVVEAVGIQITNRGNTATGSLVIWPYTDAARRKLGIHGPSRIEIGSVRPQSSVVVIIPICPCASPGQREYSLAAAETSILVQHGDDTDPQFFRLPFAGHGMHLSLGLRDEFAQKPVVNWPSLNNRGGLRGRQGWLSQTSYPERNAMTMMGPSLVLPIDVTSCAIDLTVQPHRTARLEVELEGNEPRYVKGALAFADADAHTVASVNIAINALMNWTARVRSPSLRREQNACGWAANYDLQR
jgi:hypothetical protein